MNMNLTVAEYAKHFDMALHLQSSKEEDIRAHAWAARPAGVVACCTNSFWTPVVAEEFRSLDVRVGIAISFPYGCASTDMKFAEIEEGLRLGATAVDIVVNIGRLREGDDEFTRREVEEFVEWTRGIVLSKAIFEVCFLTDEEVAGLTRICSDTGVDYVKTAMGSQRFPTEAQVQVMQDDIINGNTKPKAPRVPRTLAMSATSWMTEQLGVSPIDTRSAASFVQQYAAHLGTNREVG